MAAGQRPWWHLRRIDIMFVLGVFAFINEELADKSDRTIVLAALLLMGLPIVNRVDDVVRNGNGRK